MTNAPVQNPTARSRGSMSQGVIAKVFSQMTVVMTPSHFQRVGREAYNCSTAKLMRGSI
jgi:hypothetical protein